MPSLLYPTNDQLLAVRIRRANGACITVIPDPQLNTYAVDEIKYTYPTAFFESNGVYELQLLQYSKK